MEIRKSTLQDLDAMLQVYETARAYMAEHGNPTQWGTSYPERDMLVGDIRRGESYVMLDGRRIVGHVEEEEALSLIGILSCGQGRLRPVLRLHDGGVPDGREAFRGSVYKSFYPGRSQLLRHRYEPAWKSRSKAV